MHIAQFVHRYPPALGGAEAYTARLCEYLAGRGDDVRVWTTTAVELEELWRAGGVSSTRQRHVKQVEVHSGAYARRSPG